MRNTQSVSLARFRLAPLVLAVATAGAIAQDKLALEEIIVTAQKREQQMQDVPISMTVDTAGKRPFRDGSRASGGIVGCRSLRARPASRRGRSQALPAPPSS